MSLFHTMQNYREWREVLEKHYGGIDGFEDPTTVKRWRTWLIEVVSDEDQMRRDIERDPESYRDWVKDSEIPYQEAKQGILDLEEWFRKCGYEIPGKASA